MENETLKEALNGDSAALFKENSELKEELRRLKE